MYVLLWRYFNGRFYRFEILMCRRLWCVIIFVQNVIMIFSIELWIVLAETLKYKERWKDERFKTCLQRNCSLYADVWTLFPKFLKTFLKHPIKTVVQKMFGISGISNNQLNVNTFHNLLQLLFSFDLHCYKYLVNINLSLPIMQAMMPLQSIRLQQFC